MCTYAIHLPLSSHPTTQNTNTMSAATKKKKAVMVNCKLCNTPFDLNNLKRTLGEFSMVYILCYCSAQCYTKSRLTTKS